MLIRDLLLSSKMAAEKSGRLSIVGDMTPVTVAGVLLAQSNGDAQKALAVLDTIHGYLREALRDERQIRLVRP